MKKLIVISLLIFSITTSCNKQVTTNSPQLIPVPVDMNETHEHFKLNNKATIQINHPILIKEAKYIADIIKPATGFSLDILNTTNKIQGSIILKIDSTQTQLHNEEYNLQIEKSHITISAKTQEGIFRGIQTLRQVFPNEIEKQNTQNINWVLPTMHIHDFPKLEYRGAMLDVARHFFSVSEVKKYIDQLARYKINHLHMHLTDDQGWRIEIKSWPKLTEIGASSSVNNEKPGFYTQQQYTELVNYAASRYITIVPEIDMPGHTNAALASYAELNANNKQTELYSGIEVGFSSFAIHKEITYQFIDDVIREISSITPGPYIHIGGDESHATKHNDYIYFMNNVLDITAKYNKIAIGWDEIAHANINSEHIVQYWSNKNNTKLGVDKGAKVIFSPAKYAYLDMKYDSTTTLGLDWAGTIEVDKAYQWIPDTIIQKISNHQLFGIEAPLWSETLLTNADIEYLAFPRICGIAEIAWSPNNSLNWDEYKKRLIYHCERFEIMGVNYYKSTLLD